MATNAAKGARRRRIRGRISPACRASIAPVGRTGEHVSQPAAGRPGGSGRAGRAPRRPSTTTVSSTHGRFTSTCRSRWPIRLNRTTSGCRHSGRIRRSAGGPSGSCSSSPPVHGCRRPPSRPSERGRRTARCQASLRTRRQAAPARARPSSRGTPGDRRRATACGRHGQGEHRLAGVARQVGAERRPARSSAAARSGPDRIMSAATSTEMPPATERSREPRAAPMTPTRPR